MNVILFLLQMPQIEVNCPPGGVADQKAQNLFNQDLQTLRNYFNEKCAMANSMCKAMTVQQAEEKICELRRIKARLFPQVSVTGLFLLCRSMITLKAIK